MTSRARDLALGLALLLLAALYAWWFRSDRHLPAVLLVFVAPPLLLLAGVALQRAPARFWAGVLALFWFSHGVMSAWVHRDALLYAGIEIVLSLSIVALVSVPGMRARFAKKRSP
ncbi:membrane protein [Stenotrophomonas humi]|uniref:Membrane protein n=1 Tax=Stenotrophomonas humi TaxID=405444 RepID=A0A0R0CFA9_9GAMM|nr:DUF2069 domain-containing protein [Stenotrophomonas humi]KRG64468.1 membrane protein [Stenotrophomonas humi]